jgi:hypothetical protein
MSLRIETLTRGDAANISIIEIPSAVKHDIDTGAAQAVPPFERERIEVFHKEPSDHINSLRPDPTIIRGIHHLGFTVYFLV